MDFHGLARRELQALCKKNKIPANMTNVAMADALKGLEIVEGIEVFLNPSVSETARSSIESPAKIEITSASVQRTGGRNYSRRKFVNEDTEVTQILTRTRRSTRKTVAKELEEAKNDPLDTPAPQTGRRRVPLTSTRRKMESQLKESEEEDKNGGDVVPEDKDVFEPPAVVPSGRRRGTAVSSRRKIAGQLKEVKDETNGSLREDSVIKTVHTTRRSAWLSEMKKAADPIKIESLSIVVPDLSKEEKPKEGLNNLFDMSDQTEAKSEVIDDNCGGLEKFSEEIPDKTLGSESDSREKGDDGLDSVSELLCGKNGVGFDDSCESKDKTVSRDEEKGISDNKGLNHAAPHAPDNLHDNDENAGADQVVSSEDLFDVKIDVLENEADAFPSGEKGMSTCKDQELNDKENGTDFENMHDVHTQSDFSELAPGNAFRFENLRFNNSGELNAGEVDVSEKSVAIPVPDVCRKREDGDESETQLFQKTDGGLDEVPIFVEVKVLTLDGEHASKESTGEVGEKADDEPNLDKEPDLKDSVSEVGQDANDCLKLGGCCSLNDPASEVGEVVEDKSLKLDGEHGSKDLAGEAAKEADDGPKVDEEPVLENFTSDVGEGEDYGQKLDGFSFLNDPETESVLKKNAESFLAHEPNPGPVVEEMYTTGSISFVNVTGDDEVENNSRIEGAFSNNAESFFIQKTNPEIPMEEKCTTGYISSADVSDNEVEPQAGSEKEDTADLEMLVFKDLDKHSVPLDNATPVKKTLEHSAYSTRLTPLKKSFNKKTPVRKVIANTSDNKENTDCSGGKLVHTKETKKKKDKGEKYDLLSDSSLRQLSKMLKEKLQNRNNRNSDSGQVAAKATRPALQSLPENRRATGERTREN